MKPFSYSLTILVVVVSVLEETVHSFSPGAFLQQSYSSSSTCSTAYSKPPPTNESESSNRSITTAINLFGKKAEQANGNKSSSSPTITINGKPIKAKTGEKVSAVANRAKVKITYSCRKGDCGTCELMMNGMIVKACQAKILAGKCDMRTF